MSQYEPHPGVQPLAIAQARKDFQGGCGLDDNPYPRQTLMAHYWEWEMEDLLNDEMYRDIEKGMLGV